MDWQSVFDVRCSLCSQAGPSEASEKDEKNVLAKSYTGRSFTCIFLTSVLEIECVSFTFQGSPSFI